MARFGRDLSPDDGRQPTTRPPLPTRPVEDETSARSGRGGTGDGSQGGQDHFVAPGDPRLHDAHRPASARKPYPEPERDRAYTIRDSEIAIVAEIGVFRAVTLEDLARYRYAGDRDEGTFLYFVATHSGYFTQRQFLDFAHVQKGGMAHRLTAKALRHRHVRASLYAYHTHVYNLYSRRLYGLIDKENLRNRRRQSNELIHTRLLIRSPTVKR